MSCFSVEGPNYILFQKKYTRNIAITKLYEGPNIFEGSNDDMIIGIYPAKEAAEEAALRRAQRDGSAVCFPTYDD